MSFFTHLYLYPDSLIKKMMLFFDIRIYMRYIYHK